MENGAIYQVLDDAARRAAEYLQNLPSRCVAANPGAVAALAERDQTLPERPSEPVETLALLDRIVSPATMAMAGPRFFGFVIGGSLPVALAALAAARHAILANAGRNVEANGLFGAPPITVIIGQEAHPTLLKSLGILGLGRNRVQRVAVDDRDACGQIFYRRSKSPPFCVFRPVT